MPLLASSGVPPTKEATLDPWIDPDRAAVRALHLEPLVTWVDREWGPQRPRRVLDFGCGDMLLARLVALPTIVDGTDRDPAARAAARRARPEAVVHDEVDDIPDGSYDGVVASSVLQYLEGPDAVGEWLRRAAGWLRPDASCGVVVTDLPVVDGPGRSRDGRDLGAHLLRRLGPIGAVRELLGATRRSPGHLLAVDPDVVAVQAEVAGLVPHRLARNLSPFTGRATFTFVPCPPDLGRC